MGRLVRTLGSTVLGLAVAGSAYGATVIDLALDPAQSSATATVGSAQELAGTITVRLGTDPRQSTVTFDVIALAVASNGGATVGLDPAVPNPGLGVLSPAGVFLIPTLFLRIEQGLVTIALPITDLTGTVSIGPGGASIERLETSFAIAAAAPEGDVVIRLVAVPEPGTAWFAVGGVVLLALRVPRLRNGRLRTDARREPGE